MVSSNAKTVDEYIDSLNGERKDIIINLREFIQKLIPDAKESMSYKMPTYSFGDSYVAFTSQKHHISFYIHRTDILKKYKNELGKIDLGKSCVRFKKMEDINFNVLEKIVKEANRSYFQ